VANTSNFQLTKSLADLVRAGSSATASPAGRSLPAPAWSTRTDGRRILGPRRPHPHGGNFTLRELNADPPRERQNWITAADSESAALFRQPLHENRTITMKLLVSPQASMNAALAQVGALVDKLRKASSTPPACRWSGPRERVPVGDVHGPDRGDRGPADRPCRRWRHVGAAAPRDQPGADLPAVRGRRPCRVRHDHDEQHPVPGARATGIPGDIDALGELIVTDAATQSRRHVEWGLEGPLTYNNATSLLVDSDDMVTSGFSGAQATTTGAYDPNAAGNNSVSLTLVAGTTTAIAGTGNLSHVGVFRVKARVQSGSLSNQFRLSWKALDGPMNHNAWVSPIVSGATDWQELDLGTITIPAATLGTQRWTGQIEVAAATSSPGTAVVDYLVLVPQADGYGVARSAYTYSPGVSSAFDAFVGTTAGVALGVRTAPLGGSWATSGDATDFAFPIVIYSGRNIQIRYDDTLRQDSTGTYTGRLSPTTAAGSCSPQARHASSRRLAATTS
jgi:hypothetical protein